MRDYDFMSVKQAAEYLNLSVDCTGVIISQMPEAKRVGAKGIWMIERRYVEEYKRQREDEAAALKRVTADKYCVEDLKRIFFVSDPTARQIMKDCGGVMILGKYWADKEKVREYYKKTRGGKKNG